MIPVVLNSSEITGDFQAEEMTLHLTPQLFRMISTSIYECRERAIVQELVANSLDACKAINSTAPIEITLPTEASPQLTVLDHGIGMDVDTLMNSALAYGNSTKSFDNLAVGGFGIGLKSVFSISDSVTITTVKDGMKHVALGMMLDGRPVHKLIRSEPTEETSGTSVVIAAPAEYFEPLAQIAKTSFKHWTHDVLVDGVKTNTKPLHISAEAPVTVVPNTSGWMHNVHVCIGGFMLEVSLHRMNLNIERFTDWSSASREHYDIVVYADIGELEIAPNRERIEYTSANKDIIQKRIDSFAGEWIESMEQKRKDVLTFAAANRQLLTKEYSVSDLPALMLLGAKLRQVVKGVSLSMILSSLRSSRRYSQKQLSRNLASVENIHPLKYKTNNIISGIVNSLVHRALGTAPDVDRFTLRGSRFASFSAGVDRVVREIVEAAFAGRKHETVFVTTEIAKARFSRMFNYMDQRRLPIGPKDEHGNHTNVDVVDIVLIDHSAVTTLQELSDNLAPMVNLDFTIINDDYFVEAWTEMLEDTRPAPSAKRSSIPRQKGAPKPDVLAQQITIKMTHDEGDTILNPDHAVVLDAPFYETLETFEPVCSITGKARLLLIGEAYSTLCDLDHKGWIMNPTIRTLYGSSSLLSKIAEIVIMVPPSKSQLASKRTLEALAKLPEENYLNSTARQEVRAWLQGKVSAEQKELSIALSVIRKIIPSATTPVAVRLLPTKKLRRLFLQHTPMDRETLLRAAPNFMYVWDMSVTGSSSKMGQALTSIRSATDTYTRYGTTMDNVGAATHLSRVAEIPHIGDLQMYGLIPERVYRISRVHFRTLLENFLNPSLSEALAA